MTSTTSNLNFSVNVSSIRTVSDLTPHSPFVSFDDHGLFLSLERLRGENNRDYRQRLLQVFSRRANSAYRGLVNGITRELGLSFYYAIEVNPRTDANGSFIAPDPYIKFDGVYLYLYSDYQNGTLDCTIDRYEPGGAFEHIFRLVNRINLSAYFRAEKETDTDDFANSMVILNQSNRDEVPVEGVPASTKFRTDKYPLCKGTIFFDNSSVFEDEVATEAAVISKGKYYIDYMEGLITVYSIPPSGTSMWYKYHKFPFRAIASPVILHDVTNDNFRVKMFGQELQDDGTYAHGLATSLGKDIINELKTVYPMYWGV